MPLGWNALPGAIAILLTPPIALTLEYAVEFIADDELVEITPKSIRIRKRYLKEHERKRHRVRYELPDAANASSGSRQEIRV